ncbi:NAD(P)H-dependent oxidoreductase [Parachryseolinea silvisoli]|uniref:NAD(P)H-dependent oxidoreductase n=1 Tax=Parachryseolinea silvisoli TaxID=2873601 RepID=UPI00226586CC|nr:NAD(P)H-dependent oxidoreductase [Parachryseolinea silvisoli]MCD9018082.1 NAD(P)H-dependent oxidoreductase [Parachryseolinea silvisoli]
MNIVIVYSHPSQNSYTYQILEQLKKALLQKAWSVEVSDLYAMNFKSDMTEQEYDREAFAKVDLPVAHDVLEEHKKIQRADCIIFLYPVWWSDCPAKLKGWFDRVYTVGFAYKQSGRLPGMKIVKYGVALCTAGYPNDVLKEMGIAQSMETVMLDDRFGKRFEHKEMIILGGTLNPAELKQSHTDQISELVRKIERLNW